MLRRKVGVSPARLIRYVPNCRSLIYEALGCNVSSANLLFSTYVYIRSSVLPPHQGSLIQAYFVHGYVVLIMCIGENTFESLEDLVQDGLITLYLQHHNVAQTMHEGQMQSMVRRKKEEKKLKSLKRTHGK